MIADDWDRRFTYVVDKRFVNNASTATCVSYTTTPGSQMCFKNTTITSSSSAVVDNTSIQVQDLSSNSSSVRATDAVYAIISHGKNGYGAWTYGGTVAATQLTASSNADEILNAPTANTSGSSAPYPAFVQGDTNTVYDDIVRYKTKAQIIAAVLGITEADTCTASWDNANATAANPCTGASSVANCNALAVQVGKFCLQP